MLESTVTLLPTDDQLGLLNMKIAVRRLDAGTAMPQVILSAYTGGAHCCTSTAVLTSEADGTWRIVGLESIDGDGGYDFLDIAHGGFAVLTDIGEGFFYHFSSYAGSYAPTRIRRLVGTALQDVTRTPAYRPFLLSELRRMEQDAAHAGHQGINGYFAGWVAQKALIGQLSDAWPVMLRSYDHSAADGLSTCRVDENVWVRSPYGNGRSCPEGQKVEIPFPQALALYLAALGYITPQESAALGYDPAAIESTRRAEMDAATARYEIQLAQSWFVMTQTGECIQARSPASPGELAEADHLRGIDDTVNVLESDPESKPVVVRIAEPQGNGGLTVTTFYRGRPRCALTSQRQTKQVQDPY